MMNAVMQRPLFRKTGSPDVGEQSTFNIQSLLEDMRSNEGMRNIIGNKEADNVKGQLLDLLRKQTLVGNEELDSFTRNLMNPEFQDFMINEVTGGKQILETLLLQGNTPENFSVLIPLINDFTAFKAKNESGKRGVLPPRDDILSEEELNFLERLPPAKMPNEPRINPRLMAEGGEMESDAVGIADGLDQEEPMTVDRDPSKEGIAKVSPEQYVQLMNEVRGDEVPLEGRVQELAMTVGEQDAQKTPLSVLALVQPVFEMKEQQGIAQTQQGQQMMQQGPMPMAKGGIVHLAEGPGEEGVYSGMVGPFSLDQIKNFGLYTKPEMSDLGVASYTAGAGDVLASGSPEAILTQLSGMVKEPKTFAEILAEKQGTIDSLGLFQGQKDALKLPFLSGVTQLGLDIAGGEDVIESALNRFNQATSTALPMALQIKQQEKQLPLQLALSEYSSQKDDITEMKKFVLGKSFDLALENQKRDGVGTIGVVGQNDEAINKAFGSDVVSSLPKGTIVQKNSSGLMTTIDPDQLNPKSLVTVKGKYVTEVVNGQPQFIEVNTVLDLSNEQDLAEFNRLKGFSTKEASQLIFAPFFDTQPKVTVNPTIEIQGSKDGGEIVKRSTGTGPEGEQSLEQKYPEPISDLDFSDLGIDPFAPGPGRVDVTQYSGSDKILGLRYNTGDEALKAIEDLVLRSYTQPQTIGALSSVLRGYANLSNTVDEVLNQLTGFGLPKEFVYNNPELQKSLEDMMKIPKLIAEVESGASRYRATPKDIDKIAKERLDYGFGSSASSIRKSLIAAHKTIFDKMNTYRTSLGLDMLEYKEPEVFNEEYGASLSPKEPLTMPDFSMSNLQSTLLEAVPNADLKKYPQLLTDPIFTNAIYSLSQGASMDDVGPKFLELFNQKYGTNTE